MIKNYIYMNVIKPVKYTMYIVNHCPLLFILNLVMRSIDIGYAVDHRDMQYMKV